MKPLLFLFLFIYIAQTGFSQNTLSGKVTDKNKAPLEGTIVYIPDLKVGGMVHTDGTYTIPNLPKGTYLVEARLIGYADEIKTVNIDSTVRQNFVLENSAIQTPEVVITGNYQAIELQRNPQSTTEVTNEYLNENSATNVIDAIARTPGVSAMTDGQSISKPFIRGLGYNRVLTMNDGVVQMDQAWFDEFGIEVDPDAPQRVEILKGPASLAYGSDALAGVVNLIPEAPLPEGQIKGDILFNYQTNNGLVNKMLHLAGTKKGISWSARVDYILAHAYRDKYDGYALNTQFNNFNADGTLGIHRKRGYTQVHASYFNQLNGIVDGTRDSTGALQRAVYYPGLTPSPGLPFAYVTPTNAEAASYTPFVIYQRIQHTKVVWDNSISVGSGRITGIFSWQRNQRQETNDPTMPNTPDIYYYSNAATYDLRYISQDWKGFNFSAGLNGAYQASQSLGTLMLIPNYNLFQVGGFAIGNYTRKNLTLTGGLRYDDRIFKGIDHWVDSTQVPVAPNTPGGIHEFQGFTSNFSGLSASIGASYQLPKDLYLKANLARGFRAPNVAECGANGVHDGTFVWELGDQNLKPETSLEGDLSFGMDSKDVNFELTGFYNGLSNFIYAKALLSEIPGAGDSINNTFTPIGLGPAPVYKYTQGKAALYGGEAEVDVHPSAVPWLEFYTSASLVYGGLKAVPDSIRVLPFVPPGRVTAEIKFHIKKIGGFIKNAYVKVGVLGCFEQKQVYLQYAVYNQLPVNSPEYIASTSPAKGYALLNAGIGGDIQSRGRTVCKLYVVANNILNTPYMDYMSRFKYLPVNPVTGRVGVWNMGTNVSIKLLIPFEIKSKS